MPRMDMFFKVTVDYDAAEKPEKIGNEILRQIQKIYVVRRAELSNFVLQGSSAEND